MARRGTLWGSLGDINSRDQDLKEGLSADDVLYFSPSDDATLLPDFYGTGLGLQPWPMVPAGFGTYVAPSPDVLMGASWAAPAVVAQSKDAGAPMPQGAEGPAMTIQAVPNDARYTDGSLWGMYGDASSPANEFGSQAAEAWAQGHTGSMANVIGVIDTGIDYTHPDLYLNIWLNQREIPVTLRASLSDIDSDGLITFRDLNGAANATYVLDYNSDGRIDAGDLLNDARWENGVDEDGNGYRDDLIGWDFANNDNDPMDDHGHGTHIAGTIGALGANGIGVAGVNWNVQLVAVNLYHWFHGLSSNSVRGQAIDYFTNMAVSARAAGSVENFLATNNSWGGNTYSQTVLDAITRAAQQDILFIAGAGNNATNNDNSPYYPSQYATAPITGHEAVISVASITSSGSLWSASNFGMTSVDIAAPGSGIWSTLPNGGYASWNGTSMATPHVTGAIALYASLFPNATSAQIREALLRSATFTASFNDLVASDGRLNIPAMLAIAPPVTAFDDWLYGTNTADILAGQQGNDTLDGGDGNDTLIDDTGSDFAAFMNILDSVTVSLADGKAFSASGRDSLFGIENALGGRGADSLFGDASANLLDGYLGADTLNGDAGDDTLLGGAGNDSLIGASGNDLVAYTAATSAVTVNLLEKISMGAFGEDSLVGIENVLGGVFADSLLGDAFANEISGGAHNDTLEGGLGNDTLSGGDGADFLSFALAAGSVTASLFSNLTNGTAGNDRLSGFENILGGRFADSLQGDSRANQLNGGDGDDTLHGGAGDDTLTGAAGGDFVSYDGVTGSVTVRLASGAVSGAVGNDRLSGIEHILAGGGWDSLLGDVGANLILAGAGNDSLDGLGGNDTLIGDLGSDAVLYAGATGAVTIDLLLGYALDGLGNDSLRSIEEVVAGNFSDWLSGDSEANRLRGGAGADTLVGGLGNDTLWGGADIDLVSYADATGGVSVKLINDVTYGASGTDYLYEIENVLGSTFADTIWGDSGNETLDGQFGDDTMDSHWGDDSLIGGAGTDLLFFYTGYGEDPVTVNLATGTSSGVVFGNDSFTGFENVLGARGSDSFVGDASANGLNGGEGNDTLDGGFGNDMLDGSLGNDSLNGGGGTDFVTYASASNSITVDLAAGLALGSAGNDSLIAVENVTGGNEADSLLGDSSANHLDGGAASDTVAGGQGDDWLNGGSGQIRLTFVLPQRNPFSHIDVGINAKPAFSDLDNDGDLDLVVGRGDGDLLCFRRNSDGRFTAITGEYPANPFFGLDVGWDSAPVFVDADRDGDQDLIVGAYDGTLTTFGIGGWGIGRNYRGIDVGFNSAPVFADFDGNGYQDLLIGRSDGKIVVNSSTDTLRGIDVGSLSTPSFVDLDFDGDFDLVSGESSGALFGFVRNSFGSYDVMDGRIGWPTNPFAGIDVGWNSAPIFTDIDNDGVLDLVIGAGDGTLRLYSGQLTNRDSLAGGTGADTLEGVDGADTLDGGAGNDRLVGGAGNDLFIISDTLDSVIETAGGGADTIISSVSMTIPNHIEALRIANDVSGVTLTGGAGNDMLIGNGLANNFNGGAGDDVILVGNVTLTDIYALFAT
jgi:Ca2+-binding RTX toxin-like protein